jgi:hypothetical protein
MAVVTFTRRQVAADMFPEFLTRRGYPLIPEIDAYAREAGVPRPALLLLSASLPLWRDGVLTRTRSRWRSPYVTNEEPRERGWREIVQCGLAEDHPDGWRITARGQDVARAYQRRLRSLLRELALPADAARRAAAATARVAARIPAGAERAALARTLTTPDADEPPSDGVALNNAVNTLWGFRDDCHIGAWQAAGYEGPPFDVLSQVWTSPGDLAWATIGGSTTVEAVVKAIGAKQTAADVDRHVDRLVRRGDLARDGDAVRITARGQRARDAIEDETDRRFFATWDLDDAATARLGADLRAVIDALPSSAP